MEASRETAARRCFEPVFKQPLFASLSRRIAPGEAQTFAAGSTAAWPLVIAALRYQSPRRPMVVIPAGQKKQETLFQDLSTWIDLDPRSIKNDGPSPPICFFPAWGSLPRDGKLPQPEVITDRMETLLSFCQAKGERRGTQGPLVVASPQALIQQTFAPRNLRERLRRLCPGDKADPLELVEWLETQGYEPVAKVTQKGEIALRGGILDVSPLTSAWPIRIEFFGDEVESMRYFDPIQQLSRERTRSCLLSPAGEIKILQPLPSNQAKAPARDLGSLLDYLPNDTLLVFCDRERVEATLEDYVGQIPEDDLFHLDFDGLMAGTARRGFSVLNLAEDPDRAESGDPELDLSREGGPHSTMGLGFQEAPFSSLDIYRPITSGLPELHVKEARRREFFQQIYYWLRQNYLVAVFGNNQGELDRFQEIWRDFGLNDLPISKPPTPIIGTLSKGFVSDALGWAVITDAEIFGRYKIQRPRRLKAKSAFYVRSVLEVDFTELQSGDYVVHLQHGIGRFLGLQRLPQIRRSRRSEATASPQPDGREEPECLAIEYAPHDPDQTHPKLYVPISEAHLVSKYIGAGKTRPRLNRLGGKRWGKTKARTEQAIEDLTSELLALQASRDSQPGHAFGVDSSWHTEFENAFLFEETPDQLRAIQATKQDMEAPKPMDRLICGDVGFGKTEVAIRAAFKAVMDGKQTAVLVPTTVLAQQHYNTFQERMADYPVRMEILSRFQSQAANRKVIQDLANGAVDIAIGTHRLIQPDVAFKDLGLVIIDEEQRFGVLHKERFKQLRKLVDVLTLSATPIPRTLHLALMGARDMSTIETAPQDRLPIQTIIAPYDERLIRDAIQRELNRNGQVYFLHNRVQTIDAAALKIARLLPSARIAVGHGQMDAKALEAVMTAFVNGEADVLVATTIIESGLDIPNANTIIIDRADRFGLSDLYQLRGRVGRYKHQAYAYLLVPRHAGLLTDARKRLSAMKQYSKLGSGFKIAMRDLEIRGAGNLLGSQQSGYITAIGFDLYCKLLKQSVDRMKGRKVKPRIEVRIRCDFLAMNPSGSTDSAAGSSRPSPASLAGSQAYIPDSYIRDPTQRVEIYRKLAELDEIEAVSALKVELRDRFGPWPEGVEHLLQLAELKCLAAAKRIASIETQEEKLMLTRDHDWLMIHGKFPRLTGRSAQARLGEIKRFVNAL